VDSSTTRIVSGVSYATALRDIGDAFRARTLWLTLAQWDIRRMYRRSVLGPLWHTISAAVLVAGIGFLYGGLLDQPLDVYLPHVAIGFVIWQFIAGTLTAGTGALIHEGAILKQVAVGPLVVILRVWWRYIVIAAYQSIVPLAVLLIYPRLPGIPALWALPGLALLLVNVAWMAAALAILSARFRDVPPIVASVLQIAFFLTPVIWLKSKLPAHLWVLELNPFTHLIEIVRAPLEGAPVPAVSLLACSLLAVLGLLATFVLIAQTRRRLVYWL